MVWFSLDDFVAVCLCAFAAVVLVFDCAAWLATGCFTCFDLGWLFCCLGHARDLCCLRLFVFMLLMWVLFIAVFCYLCLAVGDGVVSVNSVGRAILCTFIGAYCFVFGC